MGQTWLPPVCPNYVVWRVKGNLTLVTCTVDWSSNRVPPPSPLCLLPDCHFSTEAMQANTPNPIHQPFLKSQCPRWSLLITCGSFVTLSPVSSWCRCSPVFPFITLTYYYFAYIACFYQPVLLQHFCLILGWMGQLCTKPNPIAADVDAPVLAELMLTEPSRLKKKKVTSDPLCLL